MKKSRITNKQGFSDVKSTGNFMAFCKNNITLTPSGNAYPASTWVNDPEQIVYNGPNNSFPIFLKWLRENSGAHDSILKYKKNYILSGGLLWKGDTEKTKILVNLKEGISTFTSDLIDDYITYGYFAVEVVFDVLGNPNSYYHIPAQMVATNRNRSEYEVRENWMSSTEKKFYSAFNYSEKAIEPGRKPELFFYEREKISNGQTYSMPDYLSAILPIMVDVEINRFNLNNIKNHFSLSTLISMFQGTNQTDETKQSVYDDLSDLFSGSNGQKFLIEYLDANTGKKTEVTNISANDWDKAYTEIVKLNSEKIQTAHSVGGMNIFGVKTPGELGGGDLNFEYQVFQANEGGNIRNEILNAFDFLFSNSNRITSELAFEVNESLNANNVSFADKFKFMTINEIRASQHLDRIEGGDVLEKSFGSTFQIEQK